MSKQFVSWEKDGPVAVVTIDRPKALNALNPAVLTQLGQCVSEANLDDDVRGIIITGAGHKAFVAGADIAAMSDMTPRQGLEFASLGLGVLQSIEDVPKPVIAAVNGFALGGGTELALACDLIYASPNAKMGQPEVKLGIIPGFGGTQRLARLLGRNRAKELIFTGDIIDAATAKEYGLVQEVVPAQELLDYCKAVIGRIAGVGPVAVAQSKVAINKGMDLALDAGIAMEKLAFSSLFGTAEQREGMTAFLAKRKPEFKNR
jgi:enoyl-CoA hydratase